MELSRTMERHFLGNLSASSAQDIRLHGRRDLRILADLAVPKVDGAVDQGR